MLFKIKQANKKVNFAEFSEKYNIPKDRTLAIDIHDAGDGLGLCFTSDGIKALDQVQDPTILVRCSKRVFRAIVSGKITPGELFLNEDLAKVYGDHALQDFVWFERLFKEVFQ